MNERSAVETNKRIEFTEEVTAALLARQLGEGEIGPVGRPVQGFSGAIFRFSYNGEPHFIRLRPREKIETQIILQEFLNQNSVPRAELVQSGFDTHLQTGYVIQKSVTGEDLLSFNAAELPDLLEEAGSILGRIHTIELPGFGELLAQDGLLEGSRNSWSEYLQSVRPDTKYLLDHDLVTSDDVEHFNQVFDKLLARSGEQGVLLHNDFHGAHLFSKDGKITAVIDWDRALVGDPLYDLAVTRVGLNMGFGENIKKGYGKVIDDEIVAHYILFVLFTKIAWRHRNKLSTVQQGISQLGTMRENNYRSS